LHAVLARTALETAAALEDVDKFDFAGFRRGAKYPVSDDRRSIALPRKGQVEWSQLPSCVTGYDKAQTEVLGDAVGLADAVARGAFCEVIVEAQLS
jgi:hypothetical protein